MAGDSSPLHALSINGEPIAGKNGRKIYFSQRRKLAEGDNEFSIVAVDTHGNRSEKIITITRKIQNIHQTGSRLSIAILPFEHQGEVSTTGEHLYDQMIDSFLEQQRFNVLPRNTVNAVLRVLTFSSADLAAPDRVMELGRIAAAGSMLTVTVIESADSVEIIGRLIDTETSTILARNDIFTEDKSFSSLATLLDGLALKFTRDFPLFTGIVIEVKNNEAVIDIGSTQQIKPNMRLLCYRKGMEITHPVTGERVGAEPEILGELTVTEVFENFSNTRLQHWRGEVKMYDQVISR
jgi:TolB-like protein